MVKLSICFTVYNQLEMLKEKLDYIVGRQFENVEIVISDDCSTEDIKSLVDTYNDERIKYVRTPYNLGHDLNILYALEHCNSKYAFVFRTRDCIYIDNINEIISTITDNPDIGFYYFSAVDEDNVPRLTFEKKVYRNEERFDGYCVIPNHPSGNLYNLEYLDIDLLKKYIQEHFDNVYGFCVHYLIKSWISNRADILTSNIVGWIYSSTLKANDVAVNSSKKKNNIYSFEYMIPRYKCEVDFELERNPKIDMLKYLREIVNRNQIFMIYRSNNILKDKRYTEHYNCDCTRTNYLKNCLEFIKLTNSYIMRLNTKEKKIIKRTMYKNTLMLLTIYRIMGIFRNKLIDSCIYNWYVKYQAERKRKK